MVADDRFLLRKKYLFWFFAFLVLCFVFIKIRGVLLPFYISAFVVILFSGLIGRFERKFHIPRALSAGIITLAFCCFFVYSLTGLFQLAIDKTNYGSSIVAYKSQLRVFLNNHFGSFLEQYHIADTLNGFINQSSQLLIDYSAYLMRSVFNYGSSFISNIFLLVLTPVVMFMMLKDMPLIKRKFYNLLPISIQKETKTLVNNVYNSVFKYLEGQTIACIVLSFLYSTALFFIGSNRFIILGIIIGFSAFIPYLGFYMATIITLFSVYGQFHDAQLVLITLVVMLFLQIIDSGFITPKIVGEKLGVHPLAVLFGVLISVPLFGIFGILFALPLVGVLNTVGKFFIKKYKDSSYYNSERFNM